MKLSLTSACVLLLLALSTAAQSKSDQDKSTNRAQVISNVEITKVDAKKNTLTVKELVQPSAAGRRGGGGGSGGGRRRGGGIGFPGGGRTGGGAGRYPGGGGGRTSANQVKEYKVFVTKDTVMKLADTNIDFSDLHVGDRATISGFPKGGKGDVEAATIIRTFQ